MNPGQLGLCFDAPPPRPAPAAAPVLVPPAPLLEWAVFRGPRLDVIPVGMRHSIIRTETAEEAVKIESILEQGKRGPWWAVLASDVEKMRAPAVAPVVVDAPVEAASEPVEVVAPPAAPKGRRKNVAPVTAPPPPPGDEADGAKGVELELQHVEAEPAGEEIITISVSTSRRERNEADAVLWTVFLDQDPDDPSWAVFTMSAGLNPLVEYAPEIVRDKSAVQACARVERLLGTSETRFFALPAEPFEGAAPGEALPASLPRWAVFTGPRFLELPAGVEPEITRAPSAQVAAELASFRHGDGLERWACAVAGSAGEKGIEAALPQDHHEPDPPGDPSTWSPDFAAEFERRVGEIFDEGAAERAAAEAPPEVKPARWRRPRSPAPIDDDDLGDPGEIAAEIAENLQEAMLAIGSMAAELENPGQRAPAKPLSKAEKLAAAQDAELRSPLEIARDICARDHEIAASHDESIKLLVPDGTKMPALPMLTPCVVDGVAMVACAAGTVSLADVLDRLARTDSTGFVLLEDIAGEIARGDPLPSNGLAGDIGEIMVATMTRAVHRGEIKNRNLERMHAEILGCSLDKLPAKLAANEAAEKARREQEKIERETQRAVTTTSDDAAGEALRPGARGKKSRAATSTATAPMDIQALAQRRLTARQIDLVRMLNVVGDRAIYGDGNEEKIDDWNNIKATVVALGGKWQPESRKGPAGFRFAPGVDIAETIRLAQDNGEIYDATVVGFFPTPWNLARATAARLGIQPGWRILEPSAGSGRLAVAARELGAVVSCIEPLAENRAALVDLGFELVGDDFLATDPMTIEPFNGLLQNPPFSQQSDAIHILHAARFVRAGGPVYSIASNGVTFRSSGPGPVLRAFLATHGGTVEALPAGSFLESGTGVQTCVVAFTACVGCRAMTCRGDG